MVAVVVNAVNLLKSRVPVMLLENVERFAIVPVIVLAKVMPVMFGLACKEMLAPEENAVNILKSNVPVILVFAIHIVPNVPVTVDENVMPVIEGLVCK